MGLKKDTRSSSAESFLKIRYDQGSSSLRGFLGPLGRVKVVGRVDGLGDHHAKALTTKQWSNCTGVEQLQLAHDFARVCAGGWVRVFVQEEW